MKTLSYQPLDPPLAPGAHLLDTPERVTLTYVPAQWAIGMRLAAICISALAATAVAVKFVFMMASFQLQFGQSLEPSFAWIAPGVKIVFALFACCWAVSEWVNFFRFPDRIRIVFDASRHTLEHITPGIIRPVLRRRWQRGEIRDISIRPLKPLFGHKTIAELRLRIQGRFLPIRLRLSHDDPAFPDRVAAAFRRVLQFPD